MAIRKKVEDIDPIPPFGPKPIVLNATFARQERNNWCWAACCDMALSQRHQPQIMQCEIAGTYLQGDCCNGSLCNSQCAIVDVERVFRKNNLGNARFVEGVLSEAALKLQLTLPQGNTVAVGLKGSANHMVLVVGFTGSLFRVYDPAEGEGEWTFDEIKNGLLRKRTWAWTWITLR